MKNNIRDKVIAITGASSGIGEAIARHLATEGAKVALGVSAPRSFGQDRRGDRSRWRPGIGTGSGRDEAQ